MITLVIMGCGGHGRELLWTAQNALNLSFDSIVFVDDSADLIGKRICDIPIVGTIEDIPKTIKNPKAASFVCAVGDPKVRKDLVNRVKLLWDGKANFSSILHKSVCRSEFVEIGQGSMVYAGSIITTQARIGKHVSINLNCTVSHDVTIEDFVNISPGVHLCGGVTLEEGCDLGTAVTVIPRKTIGKGAVVGAGACVISDIPPDSLAVGVPARVIKHDLSNSRSA